MDMGTGTGMDMGQDTSGGRRTYRAALTAVIVLTVLFVVGFVALIFGFMRQYTIYQSSRHAKAATQGTVSATAPLVMELEPGTRILSVQVTSNRLVLHLATSHGNQVEVLDLTTGKLLFRVAAPSP